MNRRWKDVFWCEMREEGKVDLGWWYGCAEMKRRNKLLDKDERPASLDGSSSNWPTELSAWLSHRWVKSNLFREYLQVGVKFPFQNDNHNQDQAGLMHPFNHRRQKPTPWTYILNKTSDSKHHFLAHVIRQNCHFPFLCISSSKDGYWEKVTWRYA